MIINPTLYCAHLDFFFSDEMPQMEINYRGGILFVPWNVVPTKMIFDKR